MCTKEETPFTTISITAVNVSNKKPHWICKRPESIQGKRLIQQVLPHNATS